MKTNPERVPYTVLSYAERRSDKSCEYAGAKLRWPLTFPWTTLNCGRCIEWATADPS